MCDVIEAVPVFDISIRQIFSLFCNDFYLITLLEKFRQLDDDDDDDDRYGGRKMCLILISTFWARIWSLKVSLEPT